VKASDCHYHVKTTCICNIRRWWFQPATSCHFQPQLKASKAFDREMSTSYIHRTTTVFSADLLWLLVEWISLSPHAVVAASRGYCNRACLVWEIKVSVQGHLFWERPTHHSYNKSLSGPLRQSETVTTFETRLRLILGSGYKSPYTCRPLISGHRPEVGCQFL